MLSVTPNVSSQSCHFYLAPLDSNNFTFVLKFVKLFAKVNFYIFYLSKLQTLYGQLRLVQDQQNFKALYFCVVICLFIFFTYSYLALIVIFGSTYLSCV